MKAIRKILPLLLVMLMLISVCAPAFAATASVTVKYVTGEKNKSIAKNKTLTGTPGKHFSVKVPDIKGYTFIGFTNTEKNDFTFSNENKTILVHYAKKVSATVNYLDSYGNKLAASTKIDGYDGKSYTVTPPHISGYTVMQIQDPRNGLFGTSNHTINVYYNSGKSTPAPSTGVRLTIQCIDRDGGGVLKTFVNQTVTLPRTVNLNDYGASLSGYNYICTTVNGVEYYNPRVTLAGDTTINFVYSSNVPWPVPVNKTASLYVAAVCEDTGDVISVLRCEDVPIGTSVALNPRSFTGYQYDYTEVNGGPDWSSTTTINSDTNVVYYYKMLDLSEPIVYDASNDAN